MKRKNLIKDFLNKCLEKIQVDGRNTSFQLTLNHGSIQILYRFYTWVLSPLLIRTKYLNI